MAYFIGQASSPWLAASDVLDANIAIAALNDRLIQDFDPASDLA